jgi:nucleotide-binding universal stress UspA family protein
MKKIVIGYDASPESVRALERTAELAKAFDAEVLVASISPALTPAAHGVGPYDPADPPDEHRAQAVAAAQKLADLGISAERVTGVGDPGESIVQLARVRKADLIVVGGRDLGAISRLLGQSVSDDVAHHASCDVLIVH